MICSASIPTSKSGSNWLDRLRSSKGFPTPHNLDLHHFLPIPNASDSPNSIAESTHSNDKQLQNPNPPPPEVTSSEPAGDKEWFGIMSNALSELFNMGEGAQSSRFPKKKSSRKQTNPRICVFNTPDVNPTEEQKSSWDNVWKVDKLIFRRKNIWKVRDKKGKSRTFGRKKRKPPPPYHNNVDVCNKKQKISSLELRALKETSGTQCGLPTNHGWNARDDKGEEVGNEAADDRTQVLRKRFPLSRLPRKTGKGGSSAVPTATGQSLLTAKNSLKEKYKTL
ncbi:hypothetical protein GQ457_03G014830 [Hibiscus cannabinus]